MLRFYGYIGILIILFVHVTLFFRIQPFISWTTPTAWTGYILLLDSIIYRLKGQSLICNRSKRFLILLPLSIVLWVIFELYNLHLVNWEYINLPDNMALRLFGYCWSFATILPAIFLTAEFLEALHLFDRARLKPVRVTKSGLSVWMGIGFIFLIGPLLVSQSVAVYLFGFVWVGFILVLDPLNNLFGKPSLFGDLEQGRLSPMLTLMAAGYICGLFWEFWNYWAHTKWIYTFPITQNIKYFEMPIVGFLGFGPFALELYAMYHVAVALGEKLFQGGIRPHQEGESVYP
jgi:hypothetical protein